MLTEDQIKSITKSKNKRKRCRELGISTTSFYRDLKKYQQNGRNALVSKSRRPNKTNITSSSIEERVIELAKSGNYRHATEITTIVNAEGISICNNTVLRILRSNSLFDKKWVDEVREGRNIKALRKRILI